MTHHLTKVAGALFALAGFAFVGHAQALSPLHLKDVTVAIPAVDEETAIEQLERPNEVPPGSQGGSGPKSVAPEPDAAAHNGEGSSAGEVQELQRAFPSTEWPPSMRKD
jgi:hypothetical protein